MLDDNYVIGVGAGHMVKKFSLWCWSNTTALEELMSNYTSLKDDLVSLLNHGNKKDVEEGGQRSYPIVHSLSEAF